MHIRHLLAAAGAVVTASLAVPAEAQQYNFTYGFNGSVIASGVITTDNTVIYPGSTNVTNVTGSRLGQSITGFQDFFDVDNGDQQIYPGRPAAYVDTLGLTYQIGDYSYNITSPSSGGGGGGNGTYTEYRYLTADPFGLQQSQFVSFFTLTPVAVTGGVPEPATWAMMIVGFAGMGAAIRRRAVKTSVSYG